MIKISIIERGETGKVLVDVGDIKNRFDQGIRDAFFDQGSRNVRYTRKEILKRNKTGRLYMIKGKLHRASAPGEYPANLTGELRKGVDYKVRGSNSMEFGDRAKHGKYLELGTKNMEPREHIVATVEKRQVDFINALEYFVDRRVKK
jgi:hypothetical protein